MSPDGTGKHKRAKLAVYEAEFRIAAPPQCTSLRFRSEHVRRFGDLTVRSRSRCGLGSRFLRGARDWFVCALRDDRESDAQRHLRVLPSQARCDRGRRGDERMSGRRRFLGSLGAAALLPTLGNAAVESAATRTASTPSRRTRGEGSGFKNPRRKMLARPVRGKTAAEKRASFFGVKFYVERPALR